MIVPANLLRVSLVIGVGLLVVLTLAKHSTHIREFVLYRPSTATFYVKQEAGDNDKPATELPYGAAGDVPLCADFDGDGKSDLAVYRLGMWFISTHATGRADDSIAFGGESGDVPLAADVDGDGKADLVIFRAGEWHVRGSRNPAVPLIFHFGAVGDVPLLGDFDGDGKVDFAVFRAGQWSVDTHRDGNAEMTFTFGGMAGEHPFALDWNGDRRTAPALFRDGEWLISLKHDGKVSAQIFFGTKGDVPVAVLTHK